MRRMADILKGLTTLSSNLTALEGEVRSVKTFYGDRYDRFAAITDAIEEGRAVGKATLDKNAIAKSLEELRVLQQLVAALIPAFNSVVKEARRLADAYIAESEAAVRAYGGVGLTPSTFDDGKPISCAQFDDDGFAALVDRIRSTRNVFDRMRLIESAIKDAATPAKDLARKHQKLNSRLKLQGKCHESLAVCALRKKVMTSETILAKRVGILCAEYGKCQERVLGSLVGTMEMMSVALGAAKLRSAMKEIPDPHTRCSQLMDLFNNTKGK